MLLNTVSLANRAYMFEGLGLIDLITDLYESVIAFPLILLAIGLLYCFFGKKFFDIANFLIGGFMGLGFMVMLSPTPQLALFLFSIIAFVVGGLIGFFVPYFMVGLVGFTLGLGIFFGISPIFGFIAGVLLGIAMIALFRFFLPVMTAFIGGSIVGSVIFSITGMETISILAGALLFVSGAIFQYFILESEKERESTE